MGIFDEKTAYEHDVVSTWSSMRRSGDIALWMNSIQSIGRTINTAAFRGELNWALTRVLQPGYQRPMKRHLAPAVWGELGLIGRLSAKGKVEI